MILFKHYPANSNLGGKADLLWTNPNPASEFSGHTISLDLSKYNSIIVECQEGTGAPGTFISSRAYISKTDIIKGDNRYMSIGSRCRIGTSAAIVRSVTSLTNSGITFDDAYQGTSLRNDGVIPYKIYGVNLQLE